MAFGRMSLRSLSVALCVVLLAALLPSVAVAAPGGKTRDYIVTLKVADSGRLIRPGNKANRQRVRQRAERTGNVTDRLTREHGFKARHRFDTAVTGFSARLTPTQAASVARDAKVASVRQARVVKLASEIVPNGISRVKAAPAGGAGPDVDVHVAVIDTGIGPQSNGGLPVAMGPAGNPELNIRGGVNCWDDPATGADETVTKSGYWGDIDGHGTHVAGTIGARDNAVGTIGVAPGAKLWAMRVFGRNGFGATVSRESDILCGIRAAIDTHYTGAPDIDVINMSLEIEGRLDYKEDCDQVLGSATADPIQRLLCEATGLGITVVAAAGNAGVSGPVNANDIVPAGFDNVITVGALADLDGAGWGNSGGIPCSDAIGEKDDTYASWSNFGPDIDIVAPGVCVASTSRDSSGDGYRTLSGTSMAAPHVTGAVARYLDDHPNTGPTKMRNLIRAAGRMDWDAKTDPVWFGVNDTDEPNRVLDTSALTGGDSVKTWLYHDGFKVSGTDKARTTRVDVQRGGGWTGTANLDVIGLPGAVGTASFGDDSLTGLTALGTNVTLDLKLNGPDGDYDLEVEANGAGVSPYLRPLDLLVDRTGPDVDDLSPRVRGGKVEIGLKGASQVYLNWDEADALSSVKSSTLQRKIGTGAWKAAGTQGVSNSLVTLKKDQNNKFRVKATDSLGNNSTSAAIEARLAVKDSVSSTWQKPGAWKTKKSSQAYGGSILTAKGSTDSLSTNVNGQAVAIVSPIGPGRGKIRIRIDGGTWQEVKLQASKISQRRVVWSRRLDPGGHQVEIQGMWGSNAVDAMLVIK